MRTVTEEFWAAVELAAGSVPNALPFGWSLGWSWQVATSVFCFIFAVA